MFLESVFYASTWNKHQPSLLPSLHELAGAGRPTIFRPRSSGAVRTPNSRNALPVASVLHRIIALRWMAVCVSPLHLLSRCPL